MRLGRMVITKIHIVRGWEECKETGTQDQHDNKRVQLFPKTGEQLL